MNFYEVYLDGALRAYYLAPSAVRAAVLCADDERCGDAGRLAVRRVPAHLEHEHHADADRRRWLEGRLSVVGAARPREVSHGA